MPAQTHSSAQPWPWTVLFWSSVCGLLYSVVFAVTGWWFLTATVTVVAVAATARWAAIYQRAPKARAEHIWRRLSLTLLVVVGLGVVAYAGRELLRDNVAGLGDTMDPRFAVCGSVLDPVAIDALAIGYPTTDAPDVPLFTPLPADAPSAACTRKIDSAGNFTGVVLIVGLCLCARATGHLAPSSTRHT